MLTEQEKIAKAKEIAHNIFLQIGNDRVLKENIINELSRLTAA